MTAIPDDRTKSPGSRLRPEWVLLRLQYPRWGWILILAVCVVGRATALCAPSKWDSYLYAAASYRLYAPDVTFEDLIPDKPPGQALLSGWLYRVIPGPPTRLTMLIPDAAFLLGGCLVFARLARLCFGPRIAVWLTLFLAVGANGYNTLDSSVAGLHVNETYMLLPMVFAVWSHLAVRNAIGRGLARGFGLGWALAIKQTAIGLALVLVVDGLVRVFAQGRNAGGREHRLGYADALHEAGISAMGTFGGMMAAWLPVVTMLGVHGWLGSHLEDLATFSGGHVSGATRSAIFSGYALRPIAAPGFWMVAGLVVGCFAGFRRNGPGRSGVDPSLGQDPSLDHDPTGGGLRGTLDGVARLALLWLAAEIALLMLLTRGSGHYFQQVVPPAALTGGVGIVLVRAVVQRWRWPARRWALNVTTAATVVLLLVAVMPMLSAASRRVGTLNVAEEQRVFQTWLSSGSVRQKVLGTF